MNPIDMQNPPPNAGFWIRLVAYIIDGLLLGAITKPLAMFLTSIGVGENQGNVMSIAISWMYFAVFESSEWQGTPGKKAFGLIVTDEEGRRLGVGQATKRYFAKILSVLLLGIGILMIAFTARKQGLHDKIVKTLVWKVTK